MGSVKHTYTTLSGKIIREKYGTTTVDYLYDNDGRPYKLILDLNGTKIHGYFALNLQGDVIAIIDSTGEVAVTYEYDAWGREIASSTAGDYGSSLYGENRLKYRGYYYDSETGFYYVSSRYYDPEVGRFISADSTDILEVQNDLYDKNLYSYCDNNPVVRKDSTGAVWETVFDVVSLGFSIAEVAANPYDVGAWAGLVGDTIDLIPIVTGVGEAVRGLRFVDKAGNTLEIAKATDFNSRC